MPSASFDPLPTSAPFYLLPLALGAPPVAVGDLLVIGRDPSCGLVLDDEAVADRHARLERRTTGYIVRDLMSRSGTYLNGARVHEAPLSPRDQLRIGDVAYVFSETARQPAAMTSKNLEWDRQLARLPSLAACEFPVLVVGPSGSGKELLARAVHDLSPRARGAYVGINCSALSESLIESELFGHARGSFTGATHDRKGAFETARGGTLFLDEIGDLPLALQPKLLRALENREIRPVGHDRSIETDVRVVAATHKNLADQVRLGRFREDLYYRLNVCLIRPPALVERMEDFDDLLYRFAKAYRVRFSFGAIEVLKRHSWPGNVRELKNLVARASAYFPGKHLQPDDLPALIDPATDPLLSPSTSSFGVAESGFASTGTGGSIIREIEREMIVRRLSANRGNQRKTALELGIPKSTLHDRIRSYSIDVDRARGDDRAATV